MDVDEAEVEVEVTPGPEQQATQALLAQFSPFPFAHDRRNAIFARRALMADELVFDQLLEQASIASPQSLYPPHSPDALLQLLDAIANCPWDALKKACLHFYLLAHLSPSAAARHATACALPPQFIHLAHACFLLDAGAPDDLARAVALLADARIVQDLSSKILHTLSLAPQPTASRLVRTYVRTAQPVLETYDDLAVYLRALMEHSIADAWAFQRTFSEATPTRNQLIRTILDGCLIPPKPSVLPHLLSLPLTSFEFSLLQSYALAPPEDLTPPALALLQDLITVRLLHSGKYSDAVRLARAFDSRSTAAEARQQMMRDVLAVVPDVQRRQLEQELGEEQDGGAMDASWASAGASSDVAMSWENLGASGSSKAREKTLGGARSGRLEGSPAPVLPGRPNAPFGPYSSPANSAQKRKTSANVGTNIFGTPASARPAPTPTPVVPPIPMPGLASASATPTPAGIPPILAGFRPHASASASRFTFGTPARPQQTQNGTTTPRPGAGLNARNAFYEPSPSRAGSSLFGKEPPREVRTPIRRGDVAGAGASAGVAGDATLTDENSSLYPEPQPPVEDVTMVDSDDPDAFVVRGRRRRSHLLPVGDVESADAPAQGTAVKDEHKDTARRKSKSKSNSPHRIPPGGFASFEIAGAASPPPPSRSSAKHEPAPAPRTTRTRARAADEPQPEPQRLKIPGALFDEVEDQAEEQDRVPSLPPAPAPARGGRKKRASRATSVATESTDEDDRDAPRLRRSSRLSSAEPPSPQKPTKRAPRAAADGAGTGRATRKRKNADE